MAALGPLAELSRIGESADDAVSPAAAALWLSAAASPGLDTAPYRRHLARLVKDVRTYLSGENSAERLAEALTQVLARRFGYAGCTDRLEALEAFDFATIIDRRRGSDAGLCVLYIHTVRALGFQADAVDFPARMLVSIDAGGGRLIIDPFADGTERHAPELRRMLKEALGEGAELQPRHTQSISNRSLVLRLHDAIKVQHLKSANPEAALAAVERMLLVAPKAANLWREAGILHARLDHLAEAVAALETFLEYPGYDDKRYQASAMLQELYGKLGARN